MDDAPLIAARSASDVYKPLRSAERGGAVSLIWNGWTEMPGTNGLVGGWTSDSVTGRFLSAMKIGNFQNRAAEWAGVGRKTITTWLGIGRDALAVDHPDLDVDDVETVDLAQFDPGLRPYVWLVFELRKADAHSEVELVTLWRSAAKDDWRAARDLLARRHPGRWKERVGSEVSGPGGGPVQMMAVTDAEIARSIAENPKARQLASALLAELVPASPPGIDDHGEAVEMPDEDDEDAEVLSRWAGDDE